MALDIILAVLGSCLLVCGLIGCVLPVIPGPPLGYVALWLLQATRFADFSVEFLIITAVVTIVVTVVDYTLPAWATKRWGGSRAGVVGSIIGLVMGLFFLPVGIIVGPFAGAVLGELLAGRDSKVAFRSGFGSFVGFLLGSGAKLAVCLAFGYYFVRELVV